MKKFSLKLLGVSSLLAVNVATYAQEETGDLYDLSLEDLMNIEIVSASNKSEDVFDAPLSSYSITRDEIAKAGVSSIPEALRLCPGVIVRETTHGNYDIHLRGFDNLARYTSTTEQLNLLTLVMIDNRPVFNYNQGGTYWETLPIDLVDVERIEIVKGPAAPLFGPNAVTGVINIITRNPKEKGLYTSANLQLGKPSTTIGNLAIGQKLNDALSYTVSGNFQERQRHDQSYYFIDDDLVGEDISGLPNAAIAFPKPELSLKKHGANGYLNYQPLTGPSFALSVGIQNNLVQKPYFAEAVTLSFSENTSGYVNLAGNYKGFHTKISHNRGFEDLAIGSNLFIAQYDYQQTDIVLDYLWEINSKLSLRPGFNYQGAHYDDSKYLTADSLNGFLNGIAAINAIAGSLRADYLPMKDLRLIAAVRTDKFNIQDDPYISYQFASTYKMADRYLFRAVHSRSNSGAFISNAALNVDVQEDLQFAGPGSGPFVTSIVTGNKDVKLTTVTLTEIGVRSQFTKQLQVDLEMFSQDIRDMNTLIETSRTYQATGLPAPYPAYIPDTLRRSYGNLPLTARQIGFTLSVNYVHSAKFQFRPFVTVQRTDVQDMSVAFNTLPISEANPVNLYTTIDDENLSTPAWYGGFFMNFIPVRKLNLNMNSYFFGDHQQFYAHDINPERNSTMGYIQQKLLINSKVSYQFVDKLKVYVSGRNLLGKTTREFHGADQVGRSYLAGVSYNF